MLAAPLLLLLLALQVVPPAEDFERGKIAFNRGEYGRTIEILRPLLYPDPRLDSEGQMVQAHRMLGVAHLFESQEPEASVEFRKLLQLRPEYRMDPLLDPPRVVDVFNRVLKQQESELAQLEQKRREADAEEKRRREAIQKGAAVVEKRYLRNSFAIALLPFGAGQFQNDQRRKGWLFMTSETLLAGVSLAAFTTNFALYGARPIRHCAAGSDSTASTACAGPTEDEERSQLLLKVQVVSGGLFFATAAWGIVDAVLNYRDETPLSPGPTPDTATGRPGMKIQATYLGRSALGGALSFRF